jgi:hypothetical protein
MYIYTYFSVHESRFIFGQVVAPWPYQHKFVANKAYSYCVHIIQRNLNLLLIFILYTSFLFVKYIKLTLFIPPHRAGLVLFTSIWLQSITHIIATKISHLFFCFSKSSHLFDPSFKSWYFCILSIWTTSCSIYTLNENNIFLALFLSVSLIYHETKWNSCRIYNGRVYHVHNMYANVD